MTDRSAVVPSHVSVVSDISWHAAKFEPARKKIKFTSEQTTKAQRGIRGIALLFP